MANQSNSGPDATGAPAGFGPVLDLLGKMETQVGSIAHARPAEAAATVAADEELASLREELLSADRRGYEQLESFTQALEDLKVAIPTLIDEAVNTRFLELEDAFHQHVKEIHTRSIDSFTQSVQSKIGQRIAALETSLSIHTEAMGQLREHYLKTDRNVQRLMSGLDRLTAELMRLSTGTTPNLPRTIYVPGSVRGDRTERYEERPDTRQYDSRPYDSRHAPPPESGSQQYRESEYEREENPSPRAAKKKRWRPSPVFLVPLLLFVILVPIGLVAWAIHAGGGLFASGAKDAGNQDAPLTGAAADMRMAADFASEKNYSQAESMYRKILKDDPKNRDAIKELASVLFRQQKYEEAAAILKTLPAQ